MKMRRRKTAVFLLAAIMIALVGAYAASPYYYAHCDTCNWTSAYYTGPTANADSMKAAIDHSKANPGHVVNGGLNGQE